MKKNNNFYGKLLIFNFLVIILFSTVVIINVVSTYNFESKFNNRSFILVHYINFDDKPKPLGTKYYRTIPLVIRYLNGSVVRDGVEMNESYKLKYNLSG